MDIRFIPCYLEQRLGTTSSSSILPSPQHGAIITTMSSSDPYADSISSMWRSMLRDHTNETLRRFQMLGRQSGDINIVIVTLDCPLIRPKTAHFLQALPNDSKSYPKAPR